MAALNEQLHIEDDTLDLEEGDEPPPVRVSTLFSTLSLTYNHNFLYQPSLSWGVLTLCNEPFETNLD